MSKCPACGKWTLDFDEYFARFRCFNAECAWMPASSAERAISLLRSRRQPEPIGSTQIEELGLTLTSFYDPENDALVFDFGLKEPTFDVPAGDGIMVWKISRHTGSVAGFSIFHAKKFAVSEVTVNIAARKHNLEEVLKGIPDATVSGRATRTLIERVLVTASEAHPAERPGLSAIQEAFKESLAKFKAMLPHAEPGQATVGV